MELVYMAMFFIAVSDIRYKKLVREPDRFPNAPQHRRFIK